MAAEPARTGSPGDAAGAGDEVHGAARDRRAGDADAEGSAITAEEAALVERVRRGDPSAFDALVERHMRRAFAVAYRMLGHREDAEDVVQESFLAALDGIDGFEAGRPFGPWLHRIVVNRALNARAARARRRTERLPAGARSPAESPLRSAERAELRDRLRTVLAGLPERQRLVVQLHEIEGFTSAEIGRILEVSAGTVRWHLHQARRTLRRALDAYTRRDG